MRPRWSVIGAFVMVGVLGATTAEAQEIDQPADTARFGAVENDRSVGTAVVLEWFLPTAGYAYAGSWLRGLPPAAVRTVGALLYLGSQISPLGGDPGCDGDCVAGVGLLIAGTAWAFIDVANTAQRTNARLREEGRISLVPSVSPSGAGLSVRVAAPW